MIVYLIRRIIQAVLILLGVSLITFALLYLLPADPVRQIAGRSATPATVESIRQQLGRACRDLPGRPQAPEPTGVGHRIAQKLQTLYIAFEDLECDPGRIGGAATPGASLVDGARRTRTVGG